MSGSSGESQLLSCVDARQSRCDAFGEKHRLASTSVRGLVVPQSQSTVSQGTSHDHTGYGDRSREVSSESVVIKPPSQTVVGSASIGPKYLRRVSRAVENIQESGSEQATVDIHRRFRPRSFPLRTVCSAPRPLPIPHQNSAVTGKPDTHAHPIDELAQGVLPHPPPRPRRAPSLPQTAGGRGHAYAKTAAGSEALTSKCAATVVTAKMSGHDSGRAARKLVKMSMSIR